MVKMLVSNYTPSQHAGGISFLKRLNNLKIMMDNEKPVENLGWGGWSGVSSSEFSPVSTQPGPTVMSHVHKSDWMHQVEID